MERVSQKIFIDCYPKMEKWVLSAKTNIYYRMLGFHLFTRRPTGRPLWADPSLKQCLGDIFGHNL